MTKTIESVGDKITRTMNVRKMKSENPGGRERQKGQTGNAQVVKDVQSLA